MNDDVTNSNQPAEIIDEATAKKMAMGENLYRWRDLSLIPLALILIFIGEPSAFSATIGLILIQIGVLIRIYTVSFLGEGAYSRDYFVGERLLTTGPYGIVRNPLYLGNFFLAMGLAVFCGITWFVIFVGILFAALYHLINHFEEASLSERFGDEFLDYKSRVPGFVPSSLPRLEDFDGVEPMAVLDALRMEKPYLIAIFITIIALSLIA